MSIGTLTIDGKEYVVVPKDEYLEALGKHGVRVLAEDELTELDRGDLAEFHRLENEPEVEYEQARRQLGLK
jgi:hypothetical protein